MRPDRGDARGPGESAEALAARLGVSRETAERLTLFVMLLRRWNARINLVAPSTMPRVWDRHVRDSLQLLDHLDPGAVPAGLDLGSGAGFPGLALAIAGGIPMTLVEADRRKAGFLRMAIAETGAPADVVNDRIESLAPADCPRPAIVTARALKPLSQLLALARPWLAADGAALWAWKGRRWREELTAARKDWIFTFDSHPSRTDPAARLLRIAELRPREGT